MSRWEVRCVPFIVIFLLINIALAMSKSWTQDYVGDVADQIWEYIKRHYNWSQFTKLSYARYTAIVQSSGMGKSRAADELAKKHFVIPLCLGNSSAGARR